MADEITIIPSSEEDETTEAMEIEEWRELLVSVLKNELLPITTFLQTISTRLEQMEMKLPDSNLIARLLEVNANQNQTLSGVAQTTIAAATEVLTQTLSSQEPEPKPVAAVEVTPEPVANAVAPEVARTEPENLEVNKAQPRRRRI